MRAVWLGVPAWFLEERHRNGQDKMDELWEGVVFWVPDLSLVQAQAVSRRGVEGAELVIEVLTPSDESRDKLPFYAKVGVREVWLVEPAAREVELLALAGGGYEVVPLVDGRARSPVLDIELRVANGTLELRDGNDVHVI